MTTVAHEKFAPTPEGAVLQAKATAELLKEYLRLRRLLGKYEKKVAVHGEMIKTVVLAKGTKNENGSSVLQVGDLVAQAVRQVRKSCDEEAVRAFAAAHPELTVTKEVGDAKLIAALVEAGTITPDVFGRLVLLSESFSLRVGPGSAK